jgi:acetoacetyl-CoA synthetase
MAIYRDWLEETRGLTFADHQAMWEWSTSDLDAFWQSIWEHDGVHSPTPHSAVLAEDRMPGAVWFPGATLNYAHQVFRHADAADAAGQPAIVAEDERGNRAEMSWADLKRRTASLAATLRDMGVGKGDRVAAYLPNIPETVIAFLATASIGAIWSVCAPDMGTRAVIDRFQQIEPKVLIAADGVFYAGRALDRSSEIEEIRAALPSGPKLILKETGHAAAKLAFDLSLDDGLARDDAGTASFQPEFLPFDHPLWIVYSSGTTGKPKALVHSHGGIVMAVYAALKHLDIGPSYAPNSLGERFHWYSSTGWIMWNCQVNGLLGGTTICLFDGSPSGPKDAPDWGTLWRFVAGNRVTMFGAGAAYFGNCMKAGVDPAAEVDLSGVRALGSTGSPLPEAVQNWGTDAFARMGRPDIWWSNISGGTDICGLWIAGNRELPLVPGRMQCRQLGARVEAWNESGESLVGEVGDLVCARPFPSMPVFLWGDPDGRRYLDSYFDMFPGIWRHGDWLSIGEDGSCVIYGRSDATINRHGLRIGTSEIYSAVEDLPEILDSMLIDLEYLGRPSEMLLFVVPRPGEAVDAARIKGAIRQAVSPRFVPDRIVEAPAIPRTLSGKKQEVPIRRLFLGHPIEKIISRETMANPECLDFYVGEARAHMDGARKAG